jgi:tripartite ATP-independent transporter DctM subunit
MLPPGLPLVLYAIVGSISIEEMFLAGIVPGLLLATLVALWGLGRAPRRAAVPRKLDWREARAALLDAKWELLLPAVAFLGLFAGFATPVEAAALTAVYAFVVEALVYRDLDLRRDVTRVMVECGLLVGGVLLILGVALGFANYLVDARIPERAVDWATGMMHSRWVFLLALNLFLLVAGCLLDIFSATVLLVPLMVPLGMAFGVDPLHLGVIFLVNMELGYLTPPVGMNLFFAAYRFDKPLPEVFRAALPVVGVLAIGVLMITFVPWLATGLPRLLLRG